VNRSLFTALVAAAAVALLGLLLRRMAGGARDDTTGPPLLEPGDDSPDYDEEPDDGEVIGVTSDGWQFVPDGRLVRLVRPADAEGAWSGDDGGSPRVRIGETLSPGDFTGARVKRGAENTWRVEALGRDGEFQPFTFESAEAANAALEMLERRDIVRLARDEEGRPLPPSAEAFDEARRRHEETERELAMPGDEEPGDGPG